MALNNAYLKRVYGDLEKKSSHEPEFLQAVLEVLESLEPVVERRPDLVKAGVITVADDDRDGKHGTKRFVDSHAGFIGAAGRIGDFIAAMNGPDVCGVCSRRGQSDICGRCALYKTKTMDDIYFNPEDGRGSNETE